MFCISIVLDCFMGSGITLKESYLNNRRWIGIDNSEIEIKTFEKEYQEIDNNLYNNKNYKNSKK